MYVRDLHVALGCLATDSDSVCLTLVLGTAITFALRLWLWCSGIALRAEPQSWSKLRVRVLAATASSRNSSLSNGSAQRRLLNVINLASLRFSCFIFVAAQLLPQLPAAVCCKLQVSSCQLQQPLLPGASFRLVVLALSLSWLFVKADSRIADDLCHWHRLALGDCRVTRRKLAAIDICLLQYRIWRRNAI